MPLAQIKYNHKFHQNIHCSICHEDFEPSKKIYFTTCCFSKPFPNLPSTVFDNQCLEKHIRINGNISNLGKTFPCLICRKELFLPFGRIQILKNRIYSLNLDLSFLKPILISAIFFGSIGFTSSFLLNKLTNNPLIHGTVISALVGSSVLLIAVRILLLAAKLQ